MDLCGKIFDVGSLPIATGLMAFKIEFTTSVVKNPPKTPADVTVTVFFFEVINGCFQKWGNPKMDGENNGKSY